MISLKGVTKSYGALNAVQDITLEIPEGGIFGIIGKSGAGKSTLLRLAGLLERPDFGEIRYAGERVDNLPERELLLKRRTMGMIFQTFNLFASRNVRDNIAYPLEIAGRAKSEIARRVDELLSMVEISDKSKSRLRELSGGQKQRVAIARALAAEPSVLFCDEATSALDPQTTRSILALIKSLQERLRLTVIVVTHQMEVVKAICGEVAVLHAGRVAECGTVAGVWNRPSSDAAKELIGVG